MYGLIGHKLSHSFSPQIHAELGDYQYKLWELEEDEVCKFLSTAEFNAINVTIPYKKTVIPFLDEISDTAQKIGSVNTIIKSHDGRLIGHNTDYFGFSHMLCLVTNNIKGKKCVVLGSGGASLTVTSVLQDLDAGEIVIISRSGENNYQNIGRHGDAQIIINTTPVGMYPNCGESPINLNMFQHCECVLDLIYNPAKTALLLQAEKLSIPYINGLSMLAAQGKKASELFFSTSISDAVIEKITQKLQKQMMNIILIGMPGCGKSTVGKILADRLRRQFLDTDDVIEANELDTIPQIIKCHGEVYFREQEEKSVSDCCKKSSCVIATGGGAILREKNIDAMRQNGKLVFIHRDIADLATNGRPLSSTPEKLMALYEKRLPIYKRCADITVESQPTPEQTAELILKGLNL